MSYIRTKIYNPIVCGPTYLVNLQQTDYTPLPSGKSMVDLETYVSISTIGSSGWSSNYRTEPVVKIVIILINIKLEIKIFKLIPV